MFAGDGGGGGGGRRVGGGGVLFSTPAVQRPPCAAHLDASFVFFLSWDVSFFFTDAVRKEKTLSCI